MKISCVREMREMDKQAINEYGIPEEILMENAGQAAYFTVLKSYRENYDEIIKNHYQTIYIV